MFIKYNNFEKKIKITNTKYLFENNEFLFLEICYFLKEKKENLIIKYNNV